MSDCVGCTAQLAMQAAVECGVRVRWPLLVASCVGPLFPPAAGGAGGGRAWSRTGVQRCRVFGI
eukprot:7801873-Pyramimonas_sp.AAC.1